jgi:hypothetical protein
MNARHTTLQDLRAALDEIATRLTDLLETLPLRDRKVFQPAMVPGTSPALARAPRPFVLARRFAVVAALAAAALAGAAHAGDRDVTSAFPDVWADGNLVDVQIRVDGEAAPLYFAPRGDQRHYFEAFAGRNYAVVLRNNTARRIGVLLTVDGLNVVNGEITRQSPGEPMYVLGPWESATIRGWRTSLDEVRRFVFVDERRSYAERTGQANGDMGWIRVLAFREQPRVKLWSWNGPGVYGSKRAQGGDDAQGDRAKAAPEGANGSLLGDAPPTTAPRGESAQPKANEAPAPTAQRMDSRQEQLMADRDSKDAVGSFPGTGWGDRRTDRVQYVDFTPERTATDQIVFRYEYARGLAALGIHTGGRDRLRDRDGGGLVGFARAPRW